MGEFKSCNVSAIDGSKISCKPMGEVAAAAIAERLRMETCELESVLIENKMKWLILSCLHRH